MGDATQVGEDLPNGVVLPAGRQECRDCSGHGVVAGTVSYATGEPENFWPCDTCRCKGHVESDECGPDCEECAAERPTLPRAS
jgi:hypothetical protein